MIDIVQWLRSHKIQRYHDAADLIEQLREALADAEGRYLACYTAKCEVDRELEQDSINYNYKPWPYEAD